MSKICRKCGCEADDNAKFCTRCDAHFSEDSEDKTEEKTEEAAGGTQEKAPDENLSGQDFSTPRDENETKIGAEWQGNDCRWYGSSPYSDSADRKFSAEDYESRRREQVEAAKKKRFTERRKILFALAFVGLLFDFICGIGFLMCLPVAIVASVDAKRLYVSEKKTSAQLIWAMVVGYVGAVLGLIFFILLL